MVQIVVFDKQFARVGADTLKKLVPERVRSFTVGGLPCTVNNVSLCSFERDYANLVDEAKHEHASRYGKDARSLVVVLNVKCASPKRRVAESSGASRASSLHGVASVKRTLSNMTLVSTENKRARND